MTTPARPRVLCVDDDASALEGMALHLRRRCTPVLVTNPFTALRALTDDGPFAAVISDMRMPGLDGAELLARARAAAPDTVRLLLTGHADIEVALTAVNEGGIFRFLTKPCPAPALVSALEAALEQHRLIQAEKVLLEQTLTGAVAALSDLLALASPLAFGRASRVHRTVAALCARVDPPDRWSIEVAARLSQIGAIQLTPAVAEKAYFGRPLDPAEQALADRAPALADQLLARIPRLEPVRELLARQHERFDRPGGPPPVGARMLRLAAELDTLEVAGRSPPEAVAALAARPELADPPLLEALEAEAVSRAAAEVRELPIAEVRPGMVLAADVRSRAGVLLVARGHTVSAGLLARLAGMGAAVQPAVRVVVARAAAGAEEEAR